MMGQLRDAIANSECVSLNKRRESQEPAEQGRDLMTDGSV